MADKLPSPLNGGTVDANTLATIRMQAPGPSGLGDGLMHPLRSPEARAAQDAAVGNVEKLSYDAFVRQYVYEPAAKAISKQGDDFVRQNIMTMGQAAQWVNAQRNALLVSVRDERTIPFGRAVSEYLKARDKLPAAAELSKKPGAQQPGATEEKIFEAIIRSGAHTLRSVNKLAFSFRWAGAVLTMISVGVSAYLLAEARPDQGGRVASRDGGLGEAGCASGPALGGWFECVGAVPGGLGWSGSSAGSRLGERSFDWTHSFVEWVTK